MAEKKNYDAFISYRHCEKDMFVAETLHKTLEEFKLPKVLKKKGIATSKTKISRIFRDRDELPLASNLSDQINMALENSEFLIVICSPRLKESIWCKREIQEFKRLHGQDHILAVLVEGEPNDSFPDEITSKEEMVVLPDGTKELATVPVEPLAADVRGDSKKEIRKNIKEEVVRLAAPMFNVNYDDLKQRHHERMMRRIFAIAGSISAVFLAFAIVSASLALKISHQKSEILKTLAENYAADSVKAYNDNDRLLALQKAVYAVSEDEQGNSMPLTQAGQNALLNATNAYEIGFNYSPVGRIYTKNKVVAMDTDSTFSRVYIEDYAGETYIFDTATKEELAFFDVCPSASEVVTESTHFIRFVNADLVAYAAGGDLHFLDLTTKEDKIIYSFDMRIAYFEWNEPSKLMYVACEEAFVLFSPETGKTVWSTEVSPFGFQNPKCSFSSDGKVFAVSDEFGESLNLFSTQTGKLVQSISFSDDDYLNDYTFQGDILLVEYEKDLYSSLSFNSQNELVAYNIQTGEPMWSKTLYNYIDELLYLHAGGVESIGIYSGHSLLSVDPKTGETTDTWEFDSRAIRCYASTNGYFLTLTTNGSYYVSYPDSGISFDLYWDLGRDIISACITNDGIYIAEKHQMYAYILAKEKGDRVEVLVDTYDYDYTVNKTGDICYKKDYMDGTISAVRIDTDETLWSCPQTGYELCVLDGGKLVDVSSEGFRIIDENDGTLLKQVSFNGDQYFDCIQCLGDTVIYNLDMDYYRFDADTLTSEKFFSSENLPEDSAEGLSFSADGEYICYVDYEDELIKIENDGKVLFSINEILSDLEAILFFPDNKYLIIQHSSGAYGIYSLADGALVVQNFDRIESIDSVIMGTDDYPYILQTNSNAFWLNADLHPALDSYRLLYTPTNGKCLMQGNYTTYVLPVYTVEMALEDAREQLKRYK